MMTTFWETTLGTVTAGVIMILLFAGITMPLWRGWYLEEYRITAQTDLRKAATREYKELR